MDRAQSPEWDVIVVGSGVAGSLVAYKLAKAGAKVKILEAGPDMERWRLTERWRRAEPKDFMAPYPAADHAPHPDIHDWGSYLIQEGPHAYKTQYIRGVGGSTWHWAAATWRFLPSDFELKSRYGVGRDWPISYDTLEPYYQEAEEELGVYGPDEDLGSPRSKPYPMEMLPLDYMDQVFKDRLNGNGFQVVSEPAARNSRPYDNRPTCCGNNNCMPICPIGAQYCGKMHAVKARREGAMLQTDAVVSEILVGDDMAIEGVIWLSPDGEKHRERGRYVVLAANGIEIPKLMLMSRSERLPNGVGNSSDQVGRNLMDHPGIGIDFTTPEPLWPGRGPQEMTSVVNFRDGEFRAEFAAKKLHLGNMANVSGPAEKALKTAQTGAEIDAAIRDETPRRLSINCFHEQLPEPENRVQADFDKRDAMGLPRPKVWYSIGDYVRNSADHTKAQYGKIAKLMGGTDINYRLDFAYNNHIMGTTIMGEDPTSSVCDGDCRSHDHKNLFLSTSGTFSSAASVNSTLTIAALAARIADTIKADLQTY